MTWRTKKWMSSSSAPARPARLMQRCWPRPARRSCCWRPGPDWQMSDLISSDFWGRRIKPAGAPFLLEGKNPVRLRRPGRLGRGRCSAALFRQSPTASAERLQIKSEHNRALDWPISYQDVAPFYDKVAHDIGISGDAKAEEKWRPAGQCLSDAADEDLPQRRDLAEGLRVAGHPHGAGRRRHELDRIQGTAGLHLRRLVPCRAARPARSPIRRSPTSAMPERPAPRCALCSVTRVLTNAQGTKVTGVEYYDEKKERQVQEANVVVLAAWSATESAPLAQLVDRQASRRGSPIQTASSANT